jgi:hypothetical protein
MRPISRSAKVPLVDLDGRTVGMLATVEDFTDRIRAEKAPGQRT